MNRTVTGVMFTNLAIPNWGTLWSWIGMFFERLGIRMSYKKRSGRDLTGVAARTHEALNDLSLQVLSAAAVGVDGPNPLVSQDLGRFLSCKKVRPNWPLKP